MRITKAVLSIALLLSASVSALEPYSNDIVAFTNVNIIPMTGEQLLENQTLIIKNGLTDRIGDANSVKVPRKATEIDGTGKTLMPGMIDLHAHLFAGRKGNPQLLTLYLSQGVTSILNLRGGKGMLVLGEQIDSGRLIGPEMYQGSAIQGNISPTPATYEDGVAAAKQFKIEGYYFLKPYNKIPTEGYRGLMDTAKELGMPAVGHAVREPGFEAVLEAGQHFAHMEEIFYGAFDEGRNVDVERIPKIVQQVKDSGVSVVATLIVFHNIIRQVEDLDAMLAKPGVEHIHPSLGNTWQPESNEYIHRFTKEATETRLKPMFIVLQKLTAALHEAGVPVLMGTDACVTGTVPGHSAHDELLELAACGLSNFDILASATSKAATFLGADDLGNIEEGKRADLILLNANPLEDIANSRNIEGIMTRGLWQTQKEIQRQLVTYE